MECNKDNQVPCNRVYNSIINLHFLIMDLIDAISSRLTIKGKLFKQEKMAELYIVNISKNKMECRKAGKKALLSMFRPITRVFPTDAAINWQLEMA